MDKKLKEEFLKLREIVIEHKNLSIYSVLRAIDYIFKLVEIDYEKNQKEILSVFEECFPKHGGLTDFIVYDKNINIMKEKNEKLKTRISNIFLILKQ